MPKRKNGKRLVLYKSYVFRSQDPIIQTALDVVQDAGLTRAQVAKDSGVSTSTLYNWKARKTMRPQFCTVAATLGACGKRLVVADK
jgi:DNA-binding phage protein